MDKAFDAWQALANVRAKIAYLAAQFLIQTPTEDQMQELAGLVAAERVAREQLRTYAAEAA